MDPENGVIHQHLPDGQDLVNKYMYMNCAHNNIEVYFETNIFEYGHTTCKTNRTVKRIYPSSTEEFYRSPLNKFDLFGEKICVNEL